MLSERLYFNIVIRVLLITVLSVLLGFLIFKVQSLRFSIFCSLTILVTTINLMLFLNRTNRNIRFFFDSVKNDDSSLSFSVKNKKGLLKELHQSMNTVNLQIQNLKIENRQQEQFFQKILELLATGIITFDSKGFIHHANSAAKRLLSVDTLTHVNQINSIDRKLFHAIKTLNPSERQLVTVKTNQEEIQLLLKAVSSATDSDEITILSIQNIKHELDEKEVDAWMKLIRVLMHEIMNSITPITSLTESLLRIYRSGNCQIESSEITDKKISTTLQGLDVIREQGKGLMNFVDSYRKLSSIQKPELKKFMVSQLLSRINILYESLTKEENIKIEFLINDPDPEILADENMISQVLINLIKNAIEANEDNPHCIIRVTAGINSDNQPEICVSDNGQGIREENLEKIFIPFFTTHEKGTGIGLSLSRQIMGIHGGSLTVRSIPGKETVFCMRFRKQV